MKIMEKDAEDRHKMRQEKANGVYDDISLAWISSSLQFPS